jgi:hypothetical protein
MSQETAIRRSEINASHHRCHCLVRRKQAGGGRSGGDGDGLKIRPTTLSRRQLGGNSSRPVSPGLNRLPNPQTTAHAVADPVGQPGLTMASQRAYLVRPSRFRDNGSCHVAFFTYGPHRILTDLEDLPNVETSNASDLRRLGLKEPKALIGRDPFARFS